MRAIDGHQYRPDLKHAMKDLAEMMTPLESWFADRYGIDYPTDMATKGYAEAWSDAHTRARKHYVDLVGEAAEEDDVREYAVLAAEAQTADAAAWAAGTIATAMYDARPMPTKAGLRAMQDKMFALDTISHLGATEQARHTRQRAKLARQKRVFQ